MIAIERNGAYFDLTDVRIRLRMDSPLFARGFVPQSYTYPMVLRKSAANQRLMEGAERIARHEAIQEMDVTIHLGGLPWRPGILQFRGMKDGGYNVNVIVRPDALIGMATGKYLQEFELGEVTKSVISSDPATFDDYFNTYVGDIDTNDFVFAPVRNEKYFPSGKGYWGIDLGSDPYIQDPYPMVNWYQINEGSDYDWFRRPPGTSPMETGAAMSPFPYLVRIIEKLCAAFGYSVGGDVLEDAEVRRQVIVSNLWHGTQFSSGSGTEDMYWFNTDPFAGGFHLQDALPRMTVIEFITAIEKRYCARLLFLPGQRLELRSFNHVLTERRRMDVSAMVPREALFDQEADGVSALQPENEPLDSRLSGSSNVDRSLIIATVDAESDLAALSPVQGNLAIVSNTMAIWRYGPVEGVNQWIFHGYDSYTEAIGTSGERLDIGVSMTRMYGGPQAFAASEKWIIPHIDQLMHDVQGNMVGLAADRATKLRLLYYRGFQPAIGTSRTYPLLTTGTKDALGDTITGAVHSEAIDGTGGIKEVWYRRYIDLVRNMRVRKLPMPYTADIIRSFDWTEMQHAHGVDHLIRSIDVEFTDQGMGIPVVELVRVPAV